MFKIMSSEEHAKLTKDVDYWKALALKEEKRKNYIKIYMKAKYQKSLN